MYSPSLPEAESPSSLEGSGISPGLDFFVGFAGVSTSIASSASFRLRFFSFFAGVTGWAAVEGVSKANSAVMASPLCFFFFSFSFFSFVRARVHARAVPVPLLGCASEFSEFGFLGLVLALGLGRAKAREGRIAKGEGG